MPGSDADTVKERVDIVALISESVPLKRAGSNFKARCPFHDEDTPSFIVSPSRQTYHCFGCSEHGDVFTWLMKKEGMSFPEALRVLAQRVGVPLTFERPERREERERLRATLDLAATFYHRILTETADGRGARAYLEQRGLSADSIRRWRLGYCPESPSHIMEKARERGITEEDLVRCGVLRRSDRGTTEFFYGRMLFPLADSHGSVIGLAGRVLTEREGAPKYINSPETALYTKSRVLYGLDAAKDAIRKAQLAILVEGYTDVIASHQTGTTNVVATAGTALTDDHLVILRRFTDRISFAFDADAAGSAATRRAVDLALTAGFVVSVVVLPAGSDPADLAVRDPDAWKAAVGQREDLFPFLLRRALAGHARETPEGKKAITADLLPLVAQIPDRVVQGDYLQQLAAALRVDSRFLYDDLRRVIQEHGARDKGHGDAHLRAQSPTPMPQTPVIDPRIRREERLLTLLLAAPALIPATAAKLSEEALLSPETRELYGSCKAWYARSHRSRADSEDASHGERSTEPPAGTPGTGGGDVRVRGTSGLRESIPEHLRERFDHLLLAIEVERENRELDPARELGTLLRTIVLDYLRRELAARTEQLRSTTGEPRALLLQEITRMTGEIAQAERTTVSAS